MSGIQVKVVHAESPSAFFYRTLEEEPQFARMNEMIQEFYHRESGKALRFRPSPAGHLPAHVRPGSKLIVRDGEFFKRAEILKAGSTSASVHVQLVDTGRRIEIRNPIENCFKMNPKFYEDDRFAYEAHLSDVVPPEGARAWPESTRFLFERWALSEATFDLIDRGTRNPYSSLSSRPVDLCFETKVQPENPFHPPSASGPLRVKSTLSQRLLAKGLAGYVFQHFEEELQIGKNEEEQKDDDEENVVDFPVRRWPNPLPPSQSENFVRPVFADDLGQIYVQLHDDRKLIRMMTSYYAVKYDLDEDVSHHIKDKWKPNEECVAKFKDGLWYRARVLWVGAPPQGEVVVILVDFGNCMTCRPQELRIPHAFGEQPILGLRVVLDGIVPSGANKEWSPTTLDQLSNLILYDFLPGRRALCNFTTFTEGSDLNFMPLPCKLEIEHEGKMRDVAELLVEKGWARVGDLDIASRWKEFDAHANSIRFVKTSPLASPCSSSDNTLLSEDSSSSVESPFPDKDLRKLFRRGDAIKAVIHAVYGDGRIILHSRSDNYQEMRLQLQDSCEKVPPVIHPHLGMPVAGKIEKGDDYRRAFIKECLPSDRVRVLFIDSLEEVEIPRRNLRSLEQKFIPIPGYGIPLNPTEKLTDRELERIGCDINHCVEADVWVVLVEREMIYGSISFTCRDGTAFEI